MVDEDDPDDVLHHLVSAELADRLLDGATDGDDAPLRVADVAELIGALRAPVTADERADTARAATAFAGLVRAGTATLPDATMTPVQRHAYRRRARATVAISAALVLSAGAAAAATGSLPDSAQRGISTALSHVGIDVPDPDDREHVSAGGDVQASVQDETSPPTNLAGTADDELSLADAAPLDSTTTLEDPSGDATPVGPDPNGPARHGLCTAYVASGAATKPNGDSVAMTALAEAAEAAGQTVEDFCANTPALNDPTATAVTSPDESQRPSATAPGHDDESPSATAPGRSGDPSGATASVPNRNEHKPTTVPGRDNGR